MPSSLVRSRSTRRTATVTTSAPAASMARTISSLLRYLPVPTISRERSSRPAITNGVSVPCSTTVTIFGCSITLSASLASTAGSSDEGFRGKTQDKQEQEQEQEESAPSASGLGYDILPRLSLCSI